MKHDSLDGVNDPHYFDYTKEHYEQKEALKKLNQAIDDKIDSIQKNVNLVQERLDGIIDMAKEQLPF